MALPKTRTQIRILFCSAACLCLFFFLASPPPAEAGAETLVWGRVLDAGGRPIPGAVVSVSGEDLEEEASVSADAAGWYALVGLRPGAYAIRAAAPLYAAVVRPRVVCEPDGRVFAAFTLEKTGAGTGSAAVREDLFPNGRVFIPAVQIESLPTGRSVDSLIENQASTATADRIDVGGMWEAVPSLFGSRGAASWTQNVFLWNGQDVTEPFEGGTPLVVPDLFALESFFLTDSAVPIQALTPGSTVDLTPFRGTSSFHCAAQGFYLDKSFASSNITPALREEGLTESDTFNRLMDVSLRLSGPLFGGRWTYFTSWAVDTAARDLADYEPLDESRLVSGLVHLVRDGDRRRLRLFWTGQAASHSSAGAAGGVPPETTVRRNEGRHLVQILSESRPGGRSSSRYGLSFCLAGWNDDLQNGASGVQRIEKFLNIPEGTAAQTGDEKRVRASVFFDGRSFFRNVVRTHHLFEYGVRLHYAGSESAASVPGDLRLVFYDGRPLEALVFDSPFRHRQETAGLDAYVQDTINLAGGVSLSLGLHGAAVYGRGGGGSIRSLNFSPRFALRIPLSAAGSSAVRLSFVRYFWTLPLSWLAWGDPAAPGRLAFRWNDADGDAGWSEDERGPLLRREGPRYGGIDENLRLPYTDELTLAFIRGMGRGWMMSLAGFLRETRNLVETVNTGVPGAAYDPVSFFDIGDDRIPGSIDDLEFTVYDQRPETFGRDFHLLSNPGHGSRKSTYAGLDFILFKRPTDESLFFLAMTATRAFQTNGPGNTAWENDEGMIGPLYDNPNAGINAHGRPRFDRAYTIRLGISHELPFKTRAGLVVKYYDGQPFTRMIIVEDLNQGPVMIQAHGRGVARYEFNLTADFRLEKIIPFPFGSIRLMFDVFNLFNMHQATSENPWTGPEFPLRYATGIQSPRIFRLGFHFAF
ncbi:MAG TPA: carboxypeptidase-like regulatory domain-containing protein [Candidatus Aminicenantes bacterium]|nr:carboxypeptidase-like regulatory domain-containing protein [Candidatus Aminicenantes bacterium]